MSRFCNRIGSVLQTCDFFAAPIFLRFNADEQKKSKTGGCISIILIVLLLSVFSSSWIAVFNRTSIHCQYQTMSETDPSPYQLNFQNFAIAVGFDDINIMGGSDGKYFDVRFQIQILQHGSISQVIPVQMVQCQLSHFSNYTSDYQQIYTKFHLDKYLCLPQNFNLTLQGKWVSQQFTTMSINVSACTSNCVPQQKFNDYLSQNGGFKINYYLINTLINPTLNQPLSLYFQDKYYNVISDLMGIQTNLYLSQYVIQTDESLLPISSVNQLRGVFVDRGGKQQFVHSINRGTYAIFYYRKSDQKLQVSRVYRKLDDLLSYLGGLFGIMATCFGFLVDYNKCCYELEMSNKLFKCQNQYEKKKQDLTALRQAVHCAKGSMVEPSQQKSSHSNVKFNFLTYLKLQISKLLFMFMSDENWKQMKKVQDKLDQTSNQMNVDVILQKILVYEKAFQCIFSESQLTLLMLQQKMSIQDIKEQRMIMNIQDQQFIQNYSKIKSMKTSNAIANQAIVPQNQDKIKDISEQNVMLQIYDAINELKRKSSQGDEVSTNILLGIRQDILQNYQKYQQKFKNIPVHRRLVYFSKFRGSTKKISIEKVDIQPDIVLESCSRNSKTNLRVKLSKTQLKIPSNNDNTSQVVSMNTVQL